MILQIFAALVASLSFGIVFHIRGTNLFFAGLTGAVGYAAYLISGLATTTVLSALLASMAITLYAEVVARLRKAPATIFLVSGLITIVPGGGMYRTMLQALEGDLMQSLGTGYQTLLEAGAIAIGVVIVSSLMKLYIGLRRRVRAR